MKTGHPVRLKDIAEELGLSVMAVSKALRSHTDIGEETRRRVQARAAELKYRPNLLPRQMLTGRTRTIGMIVPTLESTYFAQVAHGVTTYLRSNGYNLFLCNSEASAEEEKNHVESLLAHQVDGFVLCPAGPLRSRNELAYLLDSGVPCVLAARGRPPFEANFAGSDSVAIGRAATEHLLACGCRRIAHIRGPAVVGAEQRMEGYRQALRNRGHRSPSASIAGDSDGIEAGYRAMRLLLSRTPRPDGVFCYTDLTAGGAMKALLEAGLRVPQDVAIVGVGNLVFSDILRTPLTTIEQDPVRIGIEAATTVLNLAGAKPKRELVECLVPFQLIERESSRVSSPR